jgi:tetratricopeptide (TPR) repeat protein
MLGIAHFKLGKYDDAFSEINTAVDMESKSGTGISIEMINKYPVINRIQDYTPAQKAELKPGDIIVDINSKSTKKMKEEGVLELLSSEKGTSLTLMLERNGNSFSKTITCSDIPKPDAAISFAMRSIISRYTGNKSQQKEDILIAESLRFDDETTKEYISMAKGLQAMDEGNYETTIQLMTKVPDNSFARMYEAIAFAEKSLFTASLSHYLQIPSEDLVPENIPLMQDNKVMMELYKPQVVQHKLKAEEFLTNNMPQEALFELSEAVKKTDETESQIILYKMFSIVAANPILGEIPETARKFALRSEILLKEGNLEVAASETRKAILAAPYIASLYYNMALIKSELNKYADAIRYMRIYTKGVPDAPNIRQAKDQIIKWEFMLERSKEKN